jgi:hypothetical protein
MKNNAASELYVKICRDDRYERVRWIANCLFVGGSKPTTRLRGLMWLVDNGYDVGSVSFTMPYEAIGVNGRAYVASELLDAAAKGRLELVDYDWGCPSVACKQGV